jgi:hypothetical protein
MIALERRGPMGGNARERHSLSAVTPNRPSINVRISPPEHLARLQRLTLHQLPSSRSCSRGRDSYRFACFVFRCRIRSPTTCICSTSSSVNAEAPRFGTCMQQRANQCARKCDSDLKILECGIGITANWFQDRMTLLIDIWRFLK